MDGGTFIAAATIDQVAVDELRSSSLKLKDPYRFSESQDKAPSRG
jgi:hypothetical protein